MRTEFELIQDIKDRYSLSKVGDDCAILPKDEDTDLLITTDMLVEDIDFRLEWTTPEFLGHKTLAVSLSDIAAMGGSPSWAMLTIALPEHIWNTYFIDRFYAGWFVLANKYNVELVGGDISRSPDKVVLDCVVGGHLAKGKAILRSGAAIGDSIYVTGPIGGAAAGLYLLENGIDVKSCNENQRSLLHKQLKPIPQVILANTLNQLNIVTSMIDLSDGLSSDLTHLINTSEVGAHIYADLLPLDSDIPPSVPLTDVQTQMALHGGEDFQLLFTASEKNILDTALPEIIRIGEITSNIGIIELTGDGKTIVLEPKGYRHF